MLPVLPPPSVRFALFDMDGTLLDSMPYWRNALVHALEARGFFAVPEEAKVALLSMTMAQGAEYLSALLPPNIRISPEDAFSIMLAHYQKDIRAKAGVPAYLDALQARGVRMCITSASQRYLVDTALAATKLDGYFEFILTPDEFPKGKRTPDMFLEALRRFGAKPEEAALYEDAPYSLETAKPLGLYRIGVGDDAFLAERERMCGLCHEFYKERLGIC